MNYRLVFCLICLLVIVGTVSADTLIVYGVSGEDGKTQVDKANVLGLTFSDLRNLGNATGTAKTGGGNLALGQGAGSTSGVYTQFLRGHLEFNTTSLGSGATVTDATVSLDGNWWSNQFAQTCNVSLVSWTPLTYKTIAVGDYSRGGTTALSTAIATTALVGGYNNFTITDLSFINKTGYTTFMLKTNFDLYNQEPTWGNGKYAYALFEPSDQTGKQPLITITYTTGGGGSAPVASFTSNVSSGLAPLSVQFNDTSTNTPTSWNWSFGDSNYSELQNPVYTFTECMNYSVGLTATNSVGSDTSDLQTIQVLCDPAPVASFTSNTTCGNVPFTVQFNDTSLYNVTTWNWTFENNTHSNQQNPVYQYNTSGIYGVNFSASNYFGINWSNRTAIIKAIPDWAVCPPTPTPTPIWIPVIMPSTEIQTQGWYEWVLSMWWLWILIIVGFILVRK